MSTSTPPGSEDPISPLVHGLNGQLLKALDKRLAQLETEWDPSNWIINVIVLQRRLLKEREESRLRTSATLYKGELFDDPKVLNKYTGVAELGQPVPLFDSFSGYCIRTGNVVWVDDTEMEDWHPLKNDYRAFEYVGVYPDNPAQAEYVFPIRLKVGTSEALLGVLNMEWFSPAAGGVCEFQRSGKRDAITDALLGLLDLHGAFLALTSLPPVQCDSFPVDAREGLSRAHQAALDLSTIARDGKELSDYAIGQTTSTRRRNTREP